ncbi:MAG: shikimate kinase, partial [Actinomycetota bacterium]|nr:shikimate kinase [Actinomycetota bacterium]
GAMGSGKSTIGVRLAASLGRPFVDNDAQLLERAGTTAAELAAREGVDALHATEAEAVLAALDAPDASVIAAAASTITDPVVRRALKRDGFVVWLRATPAVLASRLPRSSARPFAAEEPTALVARQARERDPLFEQIADLAVASDRSRPDAVVADILEKL